MRIIALREDEGEPLARTSFALALYLKAYAHAISSKTGRGGRLEVEPATRSEQQYYERFSFVRAPVREGRTVFRQEPL